MTRTVAILFALVASVLAIAPTMLVAQRAPTLIGVWRISHGVVAPWVKPTDPKPNAHEFIGERVTVTTARVDGDRLLTCARPNFEVTHMPAEGLFQGGLPAPAKTLAREALGFTRLPVVGISLNCDAGLYEFHQADAQTMLVAVNNVIWTLDRSPAALAEATSPSGVMQRFLEQHFAGDMGFLKPDVMAKRAFFTDSLIQRINRYFAKPSPKDVTPAIDGDPFTDSQEYPTRFSVRAGNVTGDRAAVSVRFADGYRVRRVTYLLRAQSGTWHIDDIRYGGGQPSLLALLAM